MLLLILPLVGCFLNEFGIFSIISSPLKGPDLREGQIGELDLTLKRPT